tara:strand:- start:33 stop:356 length:324 start_codon:yes stop_codon:yes gene_type:complete
MSDETDDWEDDQTFTYTITGKEVSIHQWEVQSCGKQLTESEVKRIGEDYRLWSMLEGRYGHVDKSTIPYDDTVEITFQKLENVYHTTDGEEDYQILDVDGWFKEEEE